MSDNDNESTTFEDSDGVTHVIDSGDRSGISGPPLIPRIPNRGDANAVEAEVAGKLMPLGHEGVASIKIPTAAETKRSSLKGDFQESQQDYSQQEMEISRLSGELEVLTAKAIKISASGGSIPLKLQNEITAKKNTIDFQYSRMQATTLDPAIAELETDQNLLISSYEQDMKTAVNRMQREHGVNRQLGMQLVQQMIEAVGVEKVLPHYARVNARMQSKYPSPDS